MEYVIDVPEIDHQLCRNLWAEVMHTVFEDLHKKAPKQNTKTDDEYEKAMSAWNGRRNRAIVWMSRREVAVKSFGFICLALGIISR